MRRTPWSRPLSSLGATAAAALVAITTLTAVAACGDSTAPIPTGLTDAEVAADVAALTGNAIAADVGSFQSDESAAGLGSAAAGCAYDAGSQTHVCTAVTENGLQVTRTYQFRDAADTPMQSFDAANTASVFFTRTVDGSVTVTTATGATWTGKTQRAEERTVSGLLGTETQRVWSGTGTSHDTTSYTSAAGATRRYAGDATYVAQNVVMTIPRASNPFPTSGTITRTANFTVTTTGAGAVTRTVARKVVVTFNGTALVPIAVINQASLAEVDCTLNLTTGRTSGCAARTA